VPTLRRATKLTPRRRSLVRRAVRGHAGFSLVEVLVALMLLAVGFVGIAASLGLQSGGVAAGTSRGLASVTRGNYVSTATMLAEQRMEQLKQLQFLIGPPVVDQFGADPIPQGFADEPMGTIAGYPNFSRQVRVQTGVPAANLKTVTITVNFRLPTEAGSNLEAVVIGSLVAAI
jgi:prepilin-type N-terminal cleavage/methylation domain-containing protein